MNPGSFNKKKKKLKKASVSFKYGDGRKKKLKLRYSRKKTKDFNKNVVDITLSDGRNVKQLCATGNYFGYIDY